MRLTYLVLFLSGVVFAVQPRKDASRCNPPLESAAGESEATDAPTEWVSQPVPGLYASIPVDEVILGDLTVRGHTAILRLPGQPTVIKTVQRIADPDRGNLYFDTANLKGLPSFIQVDGVVPLVPGRGVPLVLFMTLQQMKLAGIAYGGLKTANTSSVSNVRTSLELRQAPAIHAFIQANPKEQIPDKLIADAILKTQTGKYIETALTQSGHRIVGIRAKKTMTVSLMGVLSDSDRQDPSLARLMQESDPRSGQLRGLTLEDVVPYSFSLEFDLAPLPGSDLKP